MHPRRKYDLLVSEATEGVPANTDTASKDGNGATEDQEGMEPEVEGDENLQRTLPERGHNAVEEETKGPPKRSRLLNACCRQGGE